MLKLCLKDLLAARWFLLANMTVLLLYALQPYFSAGFIMAAGGVVVIAGLAIVFFLEDRDKTEILTLSLPVKRSAIVGARHLLGALFLAVCGGIVFGVIAPLGTVIRSRSDAAGLSRLLSIEAAVLFFVITLFFLALYLPLYHRFGFGRGTIVFLIAGIALVSLGAAGLFAILPAAPAPGRELGTAVIGSVRAIRSSLGTPLFLLSAVAVVVVPFAISLRLSLRFYARREF
ncbi:MAG: ABC-2 transporter permease [Candidatus Aminicenantes bacterium]|nr:ABC-2 transporter permease [Candidatus Aminicenantes bacterium]